MSTNQSEPATKSIAFAGGVWGTAASGLGIVLTCAVIYANSLAVPFLFDDASAIVRNSTIRSLANLKQAIYPPGDGETVQGRPLLNLSFAANYAWTGLSVWSWHVVNIAIHALAGLCLFGVVRQTLLSPTQAAAPHHATLLACAVALLWTVHPLQTESVTYIAQRAESLAGLLLLLTLYCSIRGAKDRGGALWQLAAVLTCLAGMAVKEVMAAAPILVVLYDWVFGGDSLTGTLRQRWRFYTALASTWLMLALLAGVSAGRGSSAGFGRGVTIWEYLRTQLTFIVLYLKLSVWPHPLVLDYGDWIASAPAAIIAAGILVALLFGATLAALCHERYRRLGFLGAWFFCILAPSSSIVPVVTQTGAEHRMYLPLAAVVVLIVVAADRFRDGARTRRTARRRGLASLAVLCGVAFLLGALTVRRNADYKTALSIWHDTAAKRPENWRAQACLADEYAEAGELSRALAAFDISIKLAPHRSASFNNRGVVHQRLRQLEEAISDFHRALEISPENANAHLNLGIALSAAGRLEPALAALSEAARIDQAAPQVHWRLGVVLMRMGRHAEAIDEFTTALDLNPQFDKPFNDRGLCYRATNRLDEAIADFSSAIAINPREAFPYLNRGVTLRIAGQLEDSIRDCSAAIRLNPGLVPAYHARAVSYASLGSFDLARADLIQLQRLGAPPDDELLEKIEDEVAQKKQKSGSSRSK